METTTFIGMLAAACTTISFLPQVIQILRTGNVDGISLQMYSIFTFGVTMWLIYGIAIQNLPMLLANLVTLILASMVLGLTVYKRHQQRRQAALEATIDQTSSAVILDKSAA
ncbi:SemiSWEET transporter [Marinobacterium sp. D7]|uniref:SemiSWEET transporter n=1 Tax=Marinobacterium ramblicola TaxID=2849041 RepID=UPI001C2D8AD6|nr:SemiSWEET transporter [Marinobacterium ramblicola]MBV1788035.1 SemiSWEET transporter [Marinobacterium ramblicola]